MPFKKQLNFKLLALLALFLLMLQTSLRAESQDQISTRLKALEASSNEIQKQLQLILQNQNEQSEKLDHLKKLVHRS